MMYAAQTHRSTAPYYAVVDRIRSLIPAVRCLRTRRELELLAAEYELLADFVDAMRAPEHSGSGARESSASQLFSAAANDPISPAAEVF
jgi:hypothetical protein